MTPSFCLERSKRSYKGFVSLIEKLPNVDCLGVLAVGPAALQVRGTVDMIIIRASEGEVVAQGRFES